MSGQIDMNELIDLLESADINVVRDVKEFIVDNVNSNKEPMMVNNLVDSYVASGCQKVLDILGCVQEPHDKHLMDRSTDHMKSGNRLRALDIIGHAVRQHPPWLHKIVTHPFLDQLIKCLKTDTDVPVLMNAVLLITFLLPIVPVSITSRLEDIFDAFQRLACFILSKPGSVAEMYQLHIQVGVHDLFTCLYGMYPCHILTYLRTKYSQLEDRSYKRLFQGSIKPMLEGVRMHPCLVTSTKESEVSNQHWRQKEVQDIIYDCEKLSLDILGEDVNDTEGEGTIATTLSKETELPGLAFDDSSKQVSLDLVLDASATNTSVNWSPSEECSLATPPMTPTFSKITANENFFAAEGTDNTGGGYEQANLSTNEAASESMVEDNLNFVPSAESIQDLMKQIKRIRFNTMATATHEKDIILHRSLSCPEVQSTVDNEIQYALPQYSSSPDAKLSIDHVDRIISLRKKSKQMGSSDETLVLPEPPNSSDVTVAAPTTTDSDMNVAIATPTSSPDHADVKKTESVVQSAGQVSIHPRRKHDHSSSVQKLVMPSPAHLLDKYMSLRVQTHHRQLAARERQSPQAQLVSLTPAEEVEILQGQVQLLHSQLLYEKHRRVLHSKRNRRLLGRIAKTTALEEQNSAMQDQLHLQEEEMQNLKEALGKSRGSCHKFRTSCDNYEYEKDVQLRLHREEMAGLQSQNHDLDSKCNKQTQELNSLNKELQQQKSLIIDQSQQLDAMKLEHAGLPDMAEQMARLNKELLLMGELQQKYQQRLVAVSSASQPKIEAQFLIDSLKVDLATTKSTLHQTIQKLEASKLNVAEMEVLLKQKEMDVADLKKKFMELKGEHAAQLSAAEEKYHAQMRILQAQHEEILTLHSQLQSNQQPQLGLPVSNDTSLQMGEEEEKIDDGEDIFATEATEECTEDAAGIGYD